MGVKRETVLWAELAPETKTLILTFRSACRDRSTAEGLAALYAYESQIPAVAEPKIAGLRNYYGIDSPDALTLRTGEKIEIRGFGSFRTRQRGPRTGRNPKNGQRVAVPAKTIPYFIPSKEIRALINNSAVSSKAPALA